MHFFSRNTRGMSTLAVALIVVLVVAVVAAAAIGFMFWPFGKVTGSGKLVTQQMEFSDFTVVQVEHAFQVEITQSSAYSVSVTADDNLIERVQVSKKGETLQVGIEPGYEMCCRWTMLRAEVTMPDLYELRLSGASSGTVRGFSSSHSFVLRVSGASSVNAVDMSAGDVEVDVSGSSKVTGRIVASGDARFAVDGASTLGLGGAANDLLIDAEGASNVELSGFSVHNARVNLEGASSATVNLDGRLDGHLTGASKLLYIGDPTLGDIVTEGGSTVGKK